VKSDQNFQRSQATVEGTEKNRITVGESLHPGGANYNITVRSFPAT